MLVVEAACRPRLQPWAAWHCVYDVKHLHRRAKEGFRSCLSGTARKARLVQDYDLGCDLAVVVQLGMQGPGRSPGRNLGTDLVYTKADAS